MIQKGMSNQDIADEIIRLYGQESSRRGTWETHWQQIADRFFPLANEKFERTTITKGNKRNDQIFDSTGVRALNRFAAILDSLLTPRNQTWHRLVPSLDELKDYREVSLWFEQVNRVLFKHRYAPSANFAAQNQMNFKMLGAFGTSGLFIDQLATGRGLRYKNCHLGELYIFENHQGLTDGVMRHFPLTARQALQKFGMDKCPEGIKNAYEKDKEREFEFLHYVCLRDDLDLDRLDYKAMPYASYYVTLEGKTFLEEGGYTSFPYAVSRYEQAPGEKYGRSPAMDVLPAQKTLNEQKKTLLKQGHRTVDPILLVHDDGILDNFSLKPGSANAGGVSKDGRPLVHTLPIGRVDIGKDLMDDERADINDSFLVTLFQILTENPQMTATEVLERTKEKGILMAPTLGRVRAERLEPQVEREIDLLSKQGLLPPMPPVLKEAGAEFRIEYDSPLSRAQRAEEASGLIRTVESVLAVTNVTGDLSPLDHFNWDEIVPDLSEINAVPNKWRRDIEEVENIRAQRAQAQQQQQVMDSAPGLAALAKTAEGVSAS